MTSSFIKKVLAERIVDTNNYRYIALGDRIERLQLKDLDTRRAIDA